MVKYPFRVQKLLQYMIQHVSGRHIEFRHMSISLGQDCFSVHVVESASDDYNLQFITVIAYCRIIRIVLAQNFRQQSLSYIIVCLYNGTQWHEQFFLSQLDLALILLNLALSLCMFDLRGAIHI